jgi:hypothetical protein
MAKRNPPPAGYWLQCEAHYDPKRQICTPCGSPAHTESCPLSAIKTDGTLKNMQYVHHSWGQGWTGLAWTCFPFVAVREGHVQHFDNLQDFQAALGNHRFAKLALE